MRKILGFLVTVFVLALAIPSPTAAQSRTQGEFVLQPVFEQRFIVQYGTQFLAPAVRIGNAIYVGYLSDPNPTFDQCDVVWYVQAEGAIPDDAVYFLGVVVGSGNQRGYLWTREPLSPKECPGWVPPPGGKGKP